MSDEALKRQAEAQIEKFRTLRWFLSLLGLAVIVACSALPAHELAGRDTGLSVTVSITAAISLALSTGAATIWGNWHRRRAKRLRRRNRELEEKLTKARAELMREIGVRERLEIDLRETQTRRGRQ